MNNQQFGNDGRIVQFQGKAEHSTFYMNVGGQDRQSTNSCLNYLAETDPRDIKTGVYQTRGAALKECYDWILRHPQFKYWRNNSDSQVLWIRGGAGKGKTMLLSGIIDELRPTTRLADPQAKTQAKTLLSFFFCQATVPKLSNAHAVLRGLIYMLVDTKPSFLTHIQKRFKDTGEPRFGDAEAWPALCNMFLDILRDSSLDKFYIVVDALDECVQDQGKLLQFILYETKELPHVKWIISSRNHVEQRTRPVDSQSVLSLELQENAVLVSRAIGAYISDRISKLESLQDDDALKKYVQQALEGKAEGTFLWVALVVQELEDVDSWDVRQVVDDVPKGLDDLYARMIDQINQLARQNREYCRLVLSATTLANRPLQLLELGVVSGLPDVIAGDAKKMEKIVKKSGSFLTVRGKTISFVHQSAKDYLIEKASLRIFPSGSAAAHRQMFTQSLQIMKKILRRDMYNLGGLGTPISQAQKPEPDPLAAAGYSCTYWVDHLAQSGSQDELQDASTVDTFLRTRCLYWLEALSLLRSVTDGIRSIQTLGGLLREQSAASRLSGLVQDANRFILYHRVAIENSPLQVYGSALVFSPVRSMIKELFRHERPQNIAMAPPMGNDWDAQTGACLQTLEGHNNWVTSVVFSHDSSRIASGSYDHTIKIWDAQTSACLQTLEGHSHWVTSVVFSHDSSRIASGSYDNTIKIWDAQTSACLQTLEGHNNKVTSVVFSHDSSHIASGSNRNTIKIWDAQTSACLQTLEGHSHWVTSVVFSHDSSRVASGSYDQTIKIWDAQTSACLQTLEGHNFWVTSVVFSHDSSRVASGSHDKTIKIWDSQTGACLQTLEGHNHGVILVVFSHDSSRVASGSNRNTIKIWDAQTSACLQTLEGHNDRVTSVVFSHDSSRVASGSYDHTIKIWDAKTGACLQTIGITSTVIRLSFDPTGSSLFTNVGTIALCDSPTPARTTSTEALASELQSLLATQQAHIPEYQGYGVSSDGFWITRRSQNWLWLPPMYRHPVCTAVGRSGLALVLGYQSGRVLIFAFAAEDSK